MNFRGKNSFVFVIVLVLALVSLGSALGFYYFERPEIEGLTYWDSLWWVMVTLSTIGYGDIFPRTVGGRVIALFLMFAGIGTLSFLTAAIASYFIRGDGWQRLRLRNLRGHVIICGLGRKGLILARAFCAAGRTVVVLEMEEENDLIPVARELGAIVLVGDAREPGLVESAGIGRAQSVVSLCGNDGINAEVASRVREYADARTAANPLVCSVHILDPELWYLLREWEISSGGNFRLQFFNIIDTAARALLDEYPPFQIPVRETPNILLVGGGRLGHTLLVHIARAWRDVSGRGQDGAPAKLKCTLIDEDVGPTLELLHLRHPELGDICEVTPLAMKVSSPEFHRASFLFDEAGGAAVTQVYVCMNDDAAGLSAALSLHARLRDSEVPIVASMAEESGLAALLRGVGGSLRRYANLHAVGLMERACQPDLVMGGIPELLARAIHDRYIEEQEAGGQTVAQNPLLVPWDELPEEARESNRAQALHVGKKLAAIGCDIAPLTDWSAGTYQFTPDEVELMASMEHERWRAERVAAGWTLGPRQAGQKTNPALMPWEDLPDAMREYNIDAVSDIPTALADAGFQIYRLQREETETQPAS